LGNVSDFIPAIKAEKTCFIIIFKLLSIAKLQNFFQKSKHFFSLFLNFFYSGKALVKLQIWKIMKKRVS